MDTFSPTSAFTNVDLPAFVLPTTPTTATFAIKSVLYHNRAHLTSSRSCLEFTRLATSFAEVNAKRSTSIIYVAVRVCWLGVWSSASRRRSTS